MLDHEGERSLEELFGHALELSAADRESFVKWVRGQNPDLERPLRELLAEDAGGTRTYLKRDWTDSLLGNVGRYQLLERLGEGGMGVVFLARQEEPLERLVALKTIREGFASQAEAGRFETEARTLALMNHPGIASIFDAGITESGQPYFVMEFVSGLTITEFCDLFRLDIEARIRLFQSACLAVQHAHYKGILHLDLKPGNVLVSWSDGAPAPKVIDFGIARTLAGAMVDPNARVPMGTRIYASPEQFDPRGLDLDTRADIYSLGVLLFELLVGRAPFDPKKLEELGLSDLQRVLREEETPRPSATLAFDEEETDLIARRRERSPHDLRKQIRGDLDAIVERALEKDRDQRYASCSEFASDLGRYLDGFPVLAVPRKWPYLLGKFVRQNRVVVALGLLLVAALVTGIFRTTRAMQREREARAMEAHYHDEARWQTRRLGALVEFFDQTLLLGARARENDEPLTMRALFDTSVAGISEHFAGRPLDEAAVRFQVGRAYLLLSALELAQREFRLAYNIQRQHPDGHLFDLLSTLGALIHTTRIYEGNEAAEGYVEHAFLLCDEYIQERHPELSEPLRALSDLRLGPRPESAVVEARLDDLLGAMQLHIAPQDPDALVIARIVAEVGVALEERWDLPEFRLFLEGFTAAFERGLVTQAHLESAFILWVRTVGCLLEGDHSDASLQSARSLVEHADRLTENHWLSIEARRVLGLALCAHGERVAAEDVLLEAIDRVESLSRRPSYRDRRSRLGLLELGQLLEERGELQTFLSGSLARWRERREQGGGRRLWWVVGLPESSPEVYRLAADLLRAAGPDELSEEDRALSLGVALYRAGELEAAVETLAQVAPEDPVGHVFRALALRALGREAQAQDELEALPGYPSDGELRFYMEEL